MNLRIVSCVAFVCVSLEACGGSANGPETTPSHQPAQSPDHSGAPVDIDEHVQASGSDRVSALVGTPGGALSLSNGARLEIPAGSLPNRTEVVLGPGAETRTVGRREGEAQVGPMLLITPELTSANGAKFLLSIPLEILPSGFSAEDMAIAVEKEAGEQRALGMGENQTRWELYPARFQDGRLRGELDALPGYRVVFVASR